MKDCGMLDTKSIFAHMVHLTDEEIELLGQMKTNISVCVESNHKLANGITKINQLLNAGANVSIGTDGAASNNDLDILGEMSTIAVLHKAINKDASALGAETVLTMASKNGAKALYKTDIGELSEGKSADFIVISYKEPHMQPVYNHISHLVYSAKSSDVTDTYVCGKALMKDKELITLDENEIFEKSKYWSDKIINVNK
jgi:5-methylthioadenosine/S-adenosylhomocysteine deaminase